MSDMMNTPIQVSAGYGRINATWIDDTAIWVSDYFPRSNPDHEMLQLEGRKKRLIQDYKKYKLLDPTIEILETDMIDIEADNTLKIGAQLLRVTTLLMPYVDLASLRPIVELRMAPPTAEDMQKSLVNAKLRAGGEAIYNTFASAMTPERHR
jgi:hypothetical protein